MAFNKLQKGENAVSDNRFPSTRPVVRSHTYAGPNDDNKPHVQEEAKEKGSKRESGLDLPRVQCQLMHTTCAEHQPLGRERRRRLT